MHYCAWKELIAFLWLPKGWPPVGTISIVFLSWCKQESNWNPDVHPAVKKRVGRSRSVAALWPVLLSPGATDKGFSIYNKGQFFLQIGVISVTKLTLCSWNCLKKPVILRATAWCSTKGRCQKKYLKAQPRLLLTCSSGNVDLQLLGPLPAPDIR